MPSTHVVHPAATEFHPEFGYLCPGPQLRRMVRVALISTALGATVGAAGVLALMPRGEPSLMRAETALAAVAADESVAAPAVTAGGEEIVQPPSAVGAKPCTAQTWPYLDSNCLSGFERKWQDLRVLRPEEPAQSAPAQVMPVTTPEMGATKSMADPKVPSKKKEKTAERRRNKRSKPFAEPDARSAYATPYERRYEQPRRDWGWN